VKIGFLDDLTLSGDLDMVETDVAVIEQAAAETVFPSTEQSVR